MSNYVSFNPFAVAAFALAAFILVVYSPYWAKRRRRARVIAERHARVAEDRAWAHRHDEADVALRLRWERHVAAIDAGGHSVAACDADVDGPDFGVREAETRLGVPHLA